MTSEEKRFIELYEAHSEELHAFCIRRVGPDLAPDLVADVFAVVWRRISESIDQPRAWLFGIARGVIRNRWRSTRRLKKLEAKVASQAAVDSSLPPDPGFGDNIVTQALDQLSRLDREILQMSAWDGLSGTEIASVLGVKPSAVHQRLHRAKQRLADKITAMEGDTS